MPEGEGYILFNNIAYMYILIFIKIGIIHRIAAVAQNFQNLKSIYFPYTRNTPTSW